MKFSVVRLYQTPFWISRSWTRLLGDGIRRRVAAGREREPSAGISRRWHLRFLGIAALIAAGLFGKSVPAYAESGYRSAIELPGFLWVYGRVLYPTLEEGCLKGFDEIRRYLGYSFRDRLCASIPSPGGGHSCAFGLPEGGCAGIGGFASGAVSCDDTYINSLGGLSNVSPTNRYTCPTSGATVNVAKTAGTPPPGTCVGNPCNVATGNKFQRETDYVGAGAFPLLIQRFYNSEPTRPASLGRGWRHHYERALVLLLRPNDNFIRAVRADGRELGFRLAGTAWVGDADVNDRLEQSSDGSGWRYVTAEDAIERYDGTGRLLSITDRGGLAHTIAYDAQGRIATVSDAFGRQLGFGYDARGRVATITDPAGDAHRYAYDANGNLSSVTFPDEAVRTYRYENGSLPHALTGIEDENGSRFATYAYDAQGRATSTEHAGGANRVRFVYNADGTTTVTDALGSTRTYRFQTVAGVPRTTAIAGPPCPDCGFSAVTFDANGNVASRQDWNGHLICYRYDPARNLELQRVEGLSGTACPGSAIPGLTRTVTTEWDATFRLPKRIAEPRRITTFVYDTRGNLISKSMQATTDASGAAGFSATPTGTARTWTYSNTYSTTIAGLMTRQVIDGPRTDATDSTTYRYHATTGHLVSVTDALGHATTLGHYDAHGRPRKIIDPNGLVTTLAYDPRGRLRAKHSSGETTTYHYDRAGKLRRITLPDGSFLSYAYDAAHRLVRIHDNVGNRIVYALDAMGNRTREQIKDADGAVVRTRARVYNSLNQLLRDIGGARPGAEVTHYGYDNQGNLTSVTDAFGKVTTHHHDALNRLIRSVDPAASGAGPGGATQYAFDGLDQLIQVSDARGLDTRYALDGLGNLAQHVSPDSGTTTNSGFDAAGNLTHGIDARGVATTFSYDALNRLTQAAYASPTGSGIAPVALTYTYDAGAYGKGKLTGITDPSGVTTYTYDQQGRLTQESRVIAGATYDTGYRYDSAGRLNQIIYPSGRSVDYTFDALGRIQRITTTRTGATLTVVDNTAHQPFGPVKSFTYGNGLSAYSRSFDLNGRISAHTLGALTRTIVYDKASRITAFSHADPAFDQRFGYDNLHRLTGWSGHHSSQSLSYDAVHNRTSQSIGGTPHTYTYPATSHWLSSTTGPAARTYHYDATGNLISDGRSFTYDARGRMLRAVNGSVAADYLVNARGQRVKKTISNATATVYHYDRQGQLIAESNAAGLVEREYIYLGALPVAVIVRASNPILYFIQPDHLGTPRIVINAAGTVIWRWDSDPFGATVPDADPDGDGNKFVFNLRFPGQYYDQETSLHYNYHRDYDPQIGRYIESDPIGLAGGVNTYAYVGASPLSYVDPEGLHPLLGVLLRLLGIGLSANSIVNDPVPMIGGVGAAGSIAGAGCKDVLKEATTVIGRLKDLQKLRPGEKSLLDRLPNFGDPKANWQQNAGVLREEMRLGSPIRDASPGDTGGQFLNAERNLLRDRGWTFDPQSAYWMPPMP